MRNTKAEGVRLREGGKINKSLLTLSGVIKTLSKAKGDPNVHVRFRDSKLTQFCNHRSSEIAARLSFAA